MTLYATPMLLFLWLLPAVAAVFAYHAWRRRQSAQAFAEAGLLAQLGATARLGRRRLKAMLWLLAAALCVLALARPAWNPVPKDVQREGRDVVFVLDVSRSMLAEDLAPNRLERAKLAISDCVDVLEGDRVGLVAFAGSSVVKCPLTLDYGFFRMMLGQLEPRDVTRGGTLIGDALRKAVDEVFDNQRREHRDVVLITDGEDHESLPVDAAGKLGQEGIRLIAIGLGDENEGRRIPVSNEAGERAFLIYQGHEVWTKLDADTLREMAAQTPGGRYLNVATGSFDLGQIYLDLIASAAKTQLETQQIVEYEEKFQIFLAAAFALWTLEALIGEGRRNAA